jgi:uncharacterized membrane protein
MLFVAYENKKVVNRGFLCGPILPIYGLGSLFILLALLRYKSDPIVVFVFGVIICSALEYFTSFLLEKIFHNMWWDYYDYKYNLNGRICLSNSILFGLGALIVIYIAQPTIDVVLKYFSSKMLNIFAAVVLIIFVIDVIYSVIVAFNLRNRLIIVEELKNEKISKLPMYFEKVLKERVSKFKIYPNRLLKAFPKLKKDYVNEFTLMDTLKSKKRKRNVKK